MLPEFSLYTHDLLLAYSAAFIAIASPGPSNLMVMSTAINQGRAPATILCLGVVSGSLTWGILSAIGVAALIATSATALLVVKILGGCYLLYLAARAARSALSSADMPINAKVHTGSGAMSIYLHGYLMHITNPKAILGWTGIVALGVRPETPVSVVLLLLAGCFLISLTCNLCYAILFSTSALAQNYRKIRRWADGIFAVFFAFAGVKLLATRF